MVSFITKFYFTNKKKIKSRIRKNFHTKIKLKFCCTYSFLILDEKNDNNERERLKVVINKEEEIYFQIFDFFKFPNALMTVVALPDDELVDEAV